MSKRKIKIRYIVILPVLICALIFIRKLMKLNDLDAKEVAEIILVSPPYKKRITDQQEIEEFTRMFDITTEILSLFCHWCNKLNGFIIIKNERMR